ncbi:MAG TPA: DUF4097 family beta strand repeat-containing protein [Candidatus Limnocylindria bacterium]|nr:DUF4097 family beta strand repeat-containing protein [Candidatus Limnocylindria bacterium]
MKDLRTLALAAMLLLPAIPSEAEETWREQSRRVLETKGQARLRVENARGRIEVRRSADSNVHLEALKIARSHDRAHARELANQTMVEVSTDGGEIAVRVRYPRQMNVTVDFWDLLKGRTAPRVEMRLLIAVPERLPIALTATSGNISTEGLGGQQELKTTSGDIWVSGASGPLRATSTSGDLSMNDVLRARLTTVSGDLVVERVRGALRAETTSGDIVIRGAEDSLALHTVSGDIQADRAPRGFDAQTTSGGVTVQRAAGRVEIRTASGDVQVDLAAPLRRAAVQTASGEIDVTLDPKAGCALEMRTGSGQIDVNVPLEIKTVTRQLVTGVVRSGSAPVVLRTASGDITLASRGD